MRQRPCAEYACALGNRLIRLIDKYIVYSAAKLGIKCLHDLRHLAGAANKEQLIYLLASSFDLVKYSSGKLNRCLEQCRGYVVEFRTTYSNICHVLTVIL